MKDRIQKIDLQSRAEIIGGTFQNGRLTIKIFGKDFHIYPDAKLSSDIHINPWVTIPVLNYIINCSGLPVLSKWVPFRDLDGGKEMAALFNQRT